MAGDNVADWLRRVRRIFDGEVPEMVDCNMQWISGCVHDGATVHSDLCVGKRPMVADYGP